MTNKANITFKANATDDYTANVTMAYSKAPGSMFSVGQTMVTATATDQATNRATCTFMVTYDKKNPLIFCPDDIMTSNSTITFKVNATDDYTANVTMAYSKASGSVFPVGETIVTATATDEALNRANCTFKVTHD